MKKIFSLILCIALLVSAVPFAAVESSAASGRIYTDIEYNVSCGSAGTWDVRTFVPEEDGIYIFSSIGSLDTLGYIALAEGEAENKYIKADGGQDNNFAVTYEMTAGVTYYLGSTVLMGPTGSYKIKIIKFEIDDGTIHPITLSESTAVSTKKSNNVKFLSITPSTSGKYFYLSSGNYDTQGYIFDEYWQQIAYSDDGGAAQNFQIELDLQAGKTYYIGYAVTSETTARFNVLLYMSTYIRTVSLESGPDKDTYIKDIDAKIVAGVTYHVDLSMRGFSFRVNYANSTSEVKTYQYGIRGLDCDPSRDLLAGENDVRFSYMGNSSAFKIYVKDSPVSRLEMLHAPDKTVYYEEDIEYALDNVSEIFNISIEGMIIRVYFTDGTNSDFAVESPYGEDIEYFFFEHMLPAEDMQLGDNTFTLTYYDKPLTFTVKYSLNSNNWQYEINNGEVTLTKYIGEESAALIPERIRGYPVTTIGASCFENNTALKSVKMTEHITTIGDKAFYGCANLRELTLPTSLTSLGVQACFGLKKLEKLTWNTPNLSIVRANNTFAYMGQDLQTGTEVEFTYSCQSIPENAFYNQSNTYAPSIGKIIVGENVTSIGSNAFREVLKLSYVEWNAIQITTALGAGNSIWAKSDNAPTFEVNIGENVRAIPSYLFYASNATRAPHVNKITVNSKDTVIYDNSIVANTAIPLTFYCHYNGDTSVNSVYRYCVEKSLNYVLLDAPLDHIYLKSYLNKEDYIVGEDLDLSGLQVIAVFEDFSETDVTADIVITGYDKTAIGLQHITLSYTFIDKTASVGYDIVVSAEPLVLDYLTITAAPTKTAFYTGDVFDASGLAVSAVFTDGFTQDVSEYIILSGYNMHTAGTQDVLISYTYEDVTRTVTYPITITALVLENIRVHTLPDKTDYLVGEQLNLDGLKIIASYNSGNNADVTGYCDFIGFDSTQKGTQSITVLYAESGISKSAQFDVTVHNDLQSLSIDTLPTQRVFVVGSAFDASGIAVSAHYENGTVTDVTSSVEISGYDMNTLGEQTVQVSFTDEGVTKTATYTITVNAVSLDRLVLISAPNATQYIYEPLNTTGLYVMAIYTDSSRENVASKCTLTGYDSTVSGAQTVTATYTFGGTTLSVSFTVNVNTRTATHMEITSPAAKTQYLLGEVLNTTGLALRLYFDNDTYKTLSAQDMTITGFDSTAQGQKTVVLHYTYGGQEFSAQYSVNVINYETGIVVSPPAKTRYYYGESLDATGMYITVCMADGSTYTLDSGFQYAGYNKTIVGEQAVTVSYRSPATGRTLTNTFSVTVVNYETAISVTPPETTEYFYGDALESTGMSALLTFANGEKQLADLAKLNVSGYQATTVGSQTLSVTYTTVKGETLSDTFLVNVLNYETALHVTAPAKTVYSYGEALNTSGIGATADMADGSTAEIAAEHLSVEGYEPFTIGTQTLSVSYTTAKDTCISDTFTVEVVNNASVLRVTPPSKTTYFYGEAINTAGMTAKVTLADGSEQSIAPSALSIADYNPEQVGTQTVCVAYQSATGAVLTDYFSVTVLNFEESVTVTPPSKTAYYFGENLATAGMQVSAVMKDGSTQPIDLSDVHITGYDAYVLGNQTVTVEYLSAKAETLQDTFDVCVNNFETALSVTPPSKTSYYYGEDLDTAGMSALFTMADGTGASASVSDLTFTGYHKNSVGTQTVTAQYTTLKGDVLSDTFEVSVLNFETAMSVIPPTRVNYYYGESFNPAGLGATITMADGSTKTVGADVITLSAFDGSVLGEQTITATYITDKGESLSDTFTVSVSNYATGLSVIPPSKTEYFYGENINTAGMSAVLIEASGESTTIEGSKLTLSGYNSRKLGTQTITASYTSTTGEVLRDTFSVVVKNYEKSMRLTAPDKTAYFYGESLDKTGLCATAVMADNSESTIDGSSLVVFGYTATKLGTQTVSAMFRTAKNTTLTATFTVTVSNFETALHITTPPAKTEYYYGENLDTAGLAATLHMANGTTQAASADALSVVSYNPNRVGTQTVTVQYTNAKGDIISDTFTVLVQNFPQRLELSGTYPTEFTEGDTFSSEGLKVLAYFADGSRRDVTTLVSITGYDMHLVGTQTVTLTYAEGEKSVSAAYEILIKEESELQRADVNRDGFIDLADISVIVAAANYGLPGEQAANIRADVNRNGTVEISDIEVLLKADNYGHFVNI